MRGKNGRLRAVVPPNKLNSEYFVSGIFFDEKIVEQVIVTLPHSRGLGVSGDEIWVVQMGARGGSDEFITFFSNVHGCSNFFMMTMDALFGDILVYPYDEKNGQSYATS